MRVLASIAVLGLIASRSVAAGPEAVAVVHAHLANLESFKRFTCRYDYTFTWDGTVEEALAGRLASPTTARYVWAVDDGKFSLKVTVLEEKSNKARTSPKLETVPGRPNLMVGPMVPFTTRDFIASPTASLSYLPPDRTANVRGGGRPHNRANTLFGCFGLDDCADMMQRLLAAERGGATLAVEPVDDGPRGLVKLTVTRDGKVTNEYHFSPDHGCLLTRSLERLGDPNATEIQKEYLDPRPCPDGRWFPGRVVELDRQNGRSRGLVWDARVTELTVDQSPEPTAFEITLPPGAAVLDFDSPNKRFITRTTERVGTDDIERVHKLTEQISSGERVDTAIAQPRSSRWLPWAGGGVVALLLAAGWRLRTGRAAGGTG